MVKTIGEQAGVENSKHFFGQNSKNFRVCAPRPPKKLTVPSRLFIDCTLRDQNPLYKVQIFSGLFRLFSGKTCTASLKIYGPLACAQNNRFSFCNLNLTLNQQIVCPTIHEARRGVGEEEKPRRQGLVYSNVKQPETIIEV